MSRIRHGMYNASLDRSAYVDAIKYRSNVFSRKRLKKLNPKRLRELYAEILHEGVTCEHACFFKKKYQIVRTEYEKQFV